MRLTEAFSEAWSNSPVTPQCVQRCLHRLVKAHYQKHKRSHVIAGYVSALGSALTATGGLNTAASLLGGVSAGLLLAVATIADTDPDNIRERM